MDQCRSHTAKLNELKKSSGKGCSGGHPPAAVSYGSSLKRSSSHGSSTGQGAVLLKKPKLHYLKDMSTADAGKFATLSEYAFFDKVRKALKSEDAYFNFLRCLTLFNEEVICRQELAQMVHPFLLRFPDLSTWFRDFIGVQDNKGLELIATLGKQERMSGDLALEIDYTTCKRLGASYCALPSSYPQPKCSGRSTLCKEVSFQIIVF